MSVRPPSRLVGVDLGTKRIGIAVGSLARAMAVPWGVIERRGDRSLDHAAILAIAAENEADTIVVGLPRSLDGSLGPAAMTMADEAAQLASLAPDGVVVVTHDERFTTTEAHTRLQSAGKNAKARRALIDASAATVLLQSWIDSQ